MDGAILANDHTMLHVHRSRDFRLASGELLPELATAYATLGTLNADRSNGVLVLHGYTTGPSMLFPGSNAAEGSWSELVGPGRAIDTDRFFVICPNMLGSSYGSTGPGSVDPRSGRRYGAAFPRIAVSDIVDAQKVLLDALGIVCLVAVIGPSLGAMQAFEWGTRYPGCVERVVAAVGAPYRPAGIVSHDAVLRQFDLESVWRDGGYAQQPDAMVPCLTRMRIATLERYGIDAELAPRFPDAGERRREIERLALGWAQEFDAGALLTLARAVEDFDARGDLSRMTAPLLFVLSRSDDLFPPALARELAPLFDAAALRWSYLELDSEKGHLASGADSDLWADTLSRFLTDDVDFVHSLQRAGIHSNR
jgi:homoserine O-acetyltransferase/O-succinyltransferase